MSDPINISSNKGRYAPNLETGFEFSNLIKQLDNPKFSKRAKESLKSIYGIDVDKLKIRSREKEFSVSLIRATTARHSIQPTDRSKAEALREVLKVVDMAQLSRKKIANVSITVGDQGQITSGKISSYVPKTGIFSFLKNLMVKKQEQEVIGFDALNLYREGITSNKAIFDFHEALTKNVINQNTPGLETHYTQQSRELDKLKEIQTKIKPMLEELQGSKNLPKSRNYTELQDAFAWHGQLDRIIKLGENNLTRITSLIEDSTRRDAIGLKAIKFYEEALVSTKAVFEFSKALDGKVVNQGTPGLRTHYTKQLKELNKLKEIRTKIGPLLEKLKGNENLSRSENYEKLLDAFTWHGQLDRIIEVGEKNLSRIQTLTEQQKR